MAYLKVEGNIAHLGKIATGKTTGAKELQRDFGYKIFSIASPLKSLAVNMLGVPLDKTVHRTFLQDLGQILRKHQCDHSEEEVQIVKNWMKNNHFKDFVYSHEVFQPDVWIDSLIQNGEFIQASSEGKAVIDDPRFINETVKLIRKSFTVNKYTVPEEIRIKRIINLYGDQNMSILVNSSETEIDQCPYHYEIKTAR